MGLIKAAFHQNRRIFAPENRPFLGGLTPLKSEEIHTGIIQLCLRHTDTRHLTSIDTNRFCCAVFTWSSWSMWGFAELTRMFEKFKFLWFMTRSVFNVCTIPTWSLKQKLVIQTQLQLRHSRKVRPCQIIFEVGKVRKERHDTIEP